MVPGGPNSVYMGPTELMLPAFKYVADGSVFVVAAPIQAMLQLYKQVNDAPPNNLLDLVPLAQGLDSHQIAKLDGVYMHLYTGMAMVIPAGWFILEGTTSDTSAVVQCVCGTQQQLKLTTKEMVESVQRLCSPKTLRPFQLSVMHGASLRDRLIASSLTDGDSSKALEDSPNFNFNYYLLLLIINY